MLVTDLIIASNYNSSAFMALVLGLTLIFGTAPMLIVNLLRLLIWIRNLRDMPESWPQLLVMWLSGTVSTYMCIRCELFDSRAAEWIWMTLIVLSAIPVTYTLLLIRQNQQLNTWKVWGLGIILPGMVLSPALLSVFGD